MCWYSTFGKRKSFGATYLGGPNYPGRGAAWDPGQGTAQFPRQVERTGSPGLALGWDHCAVSQASWALAIAGLGTGMAAQLAWEEAHLGTQAREGTAQFPRQVERTGSPGLALGWDNTRIPTESKKSATQALAKLGKSR